MGKIPILKPREVESILNVLGFREVRQKGSHKQFRHQDGRITTIPFHQGRDISPITIKLILKDIGISAEDFLKHKSK